MKTSPEQTIQKSICWMLEKHPNEVLWLLTKEDSLEDSTSRPVGCWLIGILGQLKEDEPLIMTRVSNRENPEGRWGIFTSSKVKSVENSVDGYAVETENSVYSLRQLNSVMDVIHNKLQKAGFYPCEDSE